MAGHRTMRSCFPGRSRLDGLRLEQTAQASVAPAAKALVGAKLRPYDFRHSFVSLLLAERASGVEVAQQAGHSPTMALNTYRHARTS